MNAYRSTNAVVRSTKDIAATVRAELKKQLPEWKFSVTVQSYSGGSSITLALMQGPEQVVEAHHCHVQGPLPYNEEHPFKGYAQLNHYQLLSSSQRDEEMRLTNGEYLTPKGWAVMKKAVEILSTEHWDRSDSMTDYFCTNFYRHVNIGKWNKPYQVKE